MLTARAMLDRTGEERWADAWRASAEELWRRRDADGLWTQRLWGGELRSLGPAHGVVGYAFPKRVIRRRTRQSRRPDVNSVADGH